jgi:hypothetical protein
MQASLLRLSRLFAAPYNFPVIGSNPVMGFENMVEMLCDLLSSTRDNTIGPTDWRPRLLVRTRMRHGVTSTRLSVTSTRLRLASGPRLPGGHSRLRSPRAARNPNVTVPTCTLFVIGRRSSTCVWFAARWPLTTARAARTAPTCATPGPHWGEEGNVRAAPAATLRSHRTPGLCGSECV